MTEFTDAQALSLVTAQSYKINQRVYETKYPDWDFARLIYVDTSGPEWAPGVLTYTTPMAEGKANWVTAYEKDMPKAQVGQNVETRNFQLAGIGYDFNYEEVNTALNVNGSLSDRRARAARLVYQKFMYDLTLFGSAEKGMGGITNYAGVPTVTAPADGTGSVSFWVNSAGVGTKTPAQIVRDINLGLQGIYLATLTTEMADTILLPVEAYNYIAGTPYSATTTETILSFVQRTNIYTVQTGQALTIRAVRELGSAGAGGTGRMVAYKNDQDYFKLHLPMPHKFLPVYQSGWGHWDIPGVFRTGGVELLSLQAVRYIDSVSQVPA